MGRGDGAVSRSKKHRNKQGRAKTISQRSHCGGRENPTAVVLPDTTTPRRTEVDVIEVAPQAGSSERQLEVHLPCATMDSVVVERDGPRRGTGGSASIFTSPVEAWAVGRSGTQSTDKNIPSNERAALNEVRTRTIQSLRDRHERGLPHARPVLPQHGIPTSVSPHPGTGGCSVRSGRGEQELPSVPHPEPQTDGRIIDAENVGTSALQRLHTLLQALNPEERLIFLRTHTLVAELRGTEEEEPRRENARVPGEVEASKLPTGAHAPGWEDVQPTARRTAPHAAEFRTHQSFPTHSTPTVGDEGEIIGDSPHDRGRRPMEEEEFLIDRRTADLPPRGGESDGEGSGGRPAP
jgi:hypothetical protein